TYHHRFCHNMVKNLYQDLNRLIGKQITSGDRPPDSEPASGQDANQCVSTLAEICGTLSMICAKSVESLEKMCQTIEEIENNRAVIVERQILRVATESDGNGTSLTETSHSSLIPGYHSATER